MAKDFLVCLEGSPGSDRATEVAIHVSRRLGASLVGLAIVDEPDIRAGSATSIGGHSFKQQRDEALIADAQKHAQEWMDRFAARCADAGVPARLLELRGRPAAKILDEMRAHQLTFLGRHTNFRFETAVEDSRTRDRILHRADKPIVLVPEGASAGDSEPAMVAYDGSSASKRALRSFAESGLGEGRPVHVASVDDDGATAYETASRAVESLRELGIPATPHNLVSPLPIADALLELRAKLGAGLIVMGAYARSRLAELIWGSVTHVLIEKTPVPLFLHH